MTKKEITKSLCDYPAALNVKETTQILRVSTKTVYKLIAEGKLPAVKVGRENRIAKSELIKYLRHGEKTSSHPGVTFTKMASNIVWTSQNTCGIVCVAEKKNKKGAENHGSSKHPSCKRTA